MSLVYGGYHYGMASMTILHSLSQWCVFSTSWSNSLTVCLISSGGRRTPPYGLVIQTMLFLWVNDPAMDCYRCKGAGKVICPTCGGSGEMHNEDHYLSDSSWGSRYVTCKECYGIGKRICPVCKGIGEINKKLAATNHI